MEAQVEAGRLRSQRRLGGDEGRMRGWSRRRVATEPSNGELRRRVAEEPGDGGHEGGLTTAAMDGRSVATKVAMLAFMTEGHEEAAQWWVAKEAAGTEGHGIAWRWRSRWSCCARIA